MKTLHHALLSTIVVLLVTATAGVSLAGAPGTFRRTPAGPESDSAWVDAHFGFTFGDLVTLDSVTTLTGEGDLAPSFGLAAFYRTSRFDFGGLVEHIGSFGFAGLERTNRTGGQFRVAATIRWRYIDEHWGALFLRVSPGLMLFRHSDPMRLQLAKIKNVDPDFELAEPLSHGFSLGFDFGLAIYLTRSLALGAHLDIITASSAVDVAGSDVDYTAIRGVFSVGLEWRL